MRTREEHKDMYLPEVIDMLLKRKPPKKCEKIIEFVFPQCSQERKKHSRKFRKCLIFK